MSDKTAISIVLPTRGRPDLVNRLFESIVATADHPGRLEVVLYLDSDDIASHSIEHPNLKLVKLIRRPAKMGLMVRACCEAAEGDYILQLNDDAVCRTSGWDSAVVTAVEAFPDRIALVWCNDEFRGRMIPNFPVVSRDVCDLMGGICPGDYYRDYIDTHLFDIFKKLEGLGHNRLVYLEDIVLEHLHFEAGKAAFDASYVKPRKFADELAYIAWEDQRRIIAAMMARRIEGSHA